MNATAKSRAALEMGAKSTPVRLTEDAIKWARIASGYTGESMAAYVSRIVLESAQRDADRLHQEMTRTGSTAKKTDPPKR